MQLQATPTDHTHLNLSIATPHGYGLVPHIQTPHSGGTVLFDLWRPLTAVLQRHIGSERREKVEMFREVISLLGIGRRTMGGLGVKREGGA